MSTYLELLRRTRSHNKARREYMRERRWSAEDWYNNWNREFAVEVDRATREFNKQK